ncbi:amphi-Trp domain-containing protein [Pseudodesulfovibrio cashew]|uniref:Amphi-Trp domain-containing protein n=1 Tax=Pseudodesulfovibrio cashew TaxID=2678688 RepID=A0A6I6JF81_9BACT|nr:amphi-Trp domain-containing protein [Pseudodesulfovibrio cashew]QGY38647.1 amphi-Trp domain-containing protein [Pseudodesulfovibrio cashew]
MSEDKRLGTNPLAWVDQAAAKPAVLPGAGPTAQAAPLPVPPAPGGCFITPADTITKEDIMSKGKVKIKQTLETAMVIAHLNDLAQSLDSGVVRAEDGDNSVVLSVPETVHFEMKLSRKKDKAKCAIELEWKDDGSQAEGFRITEG